MRSLAEFEVLYCEGGRDDRDPPTTLPEDVMVGARNRSPVFTLLARKAA